MILTNPFIHTQSIAFELSNQCNLNHAKCPHSLAREPITLPRQVVIDSLCVLASYGWRGIVEFQNYNEPLIDPRLFSLVEAARKLLPDNGIEIVTNGFGLSRQLAQELVEAGVTKFHVSLYGNVKQGQWLTENIAPLVPVSLGYHELDDRMRIYDAPIYKLATPCYQPLAFMVVYCNSEVGLCCYDWKQSITFGDLRKQPLDTIVRSEKMQAVYSRLSVGNRCLDICQRCQRARGV